jgi:hypothetical protein
MPDNSITISEWRIFSLPRCVEVCFTHYPGRNLTWSFKQCTELFQEPDGVQAEKEPPVRYRGRGIYMQYVYIQYIQFTHVYNIKLSLQAVRNTLRRPLQTSRNSRHCSVSMETTFKCVCSGGAGPSSRLFV